ATRDGGFQAEALGIAAIREYTAVQRRLGPTEVGFEVHEAVAFGIEELLDLTRRIQAFLDVVLLQRHAEGQARSVADRVADVEACAVGVDRVAGDINIQLFIVGGAIECVVTQADAVGGEIGVKEAEGQSSLVGRAVGAEADPVTGTEEVVLADRAAEDQTGALGKTEAGGHRAGRLLFHGVVDVDQVIGAGYRYGLDVHFLEEAQALETHLGLVDQVGRGPAAFHLAHFPTQHFVVGLGIAAEVDAVHVGALAGVHHEGDIDSAVFFVDLRHAIDVGEGVTLVTQATTNQVRAGGHHLAREDLARLDQQQTPHVRLGDYQVTGQLHVVDGIQLALVDVDGDVDVFLVRGNGYLGGGDIHVDVAAVQVPGTQTLQVAGEFFAGIL